MKKPLAFLCTISCAALLLANSIRRGAPDRWLRASFNPRAERAAAGDLGVGCRIASSGCPLHV